MRVLALFFEADYVGDPGLAIFFLARFVEVARAFVGTFFVFFPVSFNFVEASFLEKLDDFLNRPHTPVVSEGLLVFNTVFFEVDVVKNFVSEWVIFFAVPEV